MDPLSETQLRILREAATPEGCWKYLATSARRLRSLRFVEGRFVRPAGGLLESRLFATEKGREYLAKVCTHPADAVKAGPRMPLVYGSAPTEVCACGAWRVMHHGAGPWRRDSITEAIKEDEEG